MRDFSIKLAAFFNLYFSFESSNNLTGKRVKNIFIMNFLCEHRLHFLSTFISRKPKIDLCSWFGKTKTAVSPELSGNNFSSKQKQAGNGESWRYI